MEVLKALSLVIQSDDDLSTTVDRILVGDPETRARKVLEILHHLVGRMHPDYAIALNNLGRIAWAKGRYEEAEGIYRQALDIDRATIGPLHLSYGIHLNNLAVVVHTLGRYREAEKYYRESIQIKKHTWGDLHPITQNTIANLIACLQKSGAAPDKIAALQSRLIAQAQPDQNT